MQHFIPTTPSPGNNVPRTNLLQTFIWNVHDDTIVTGNRIYFKKTDGSLDGSIPYKDKNLTIDDQDKVDLTTGKVVTADEYAANPDSYPNVVGQYTSMMNMSIEDALTMLGHTNLKSQLATAGITDLQTTVAELILGLIDLNVIDSDTNRHKFDD